MKYECSECGCTNAEKFIFSEDRRSFRCALCGATTKVALDPNEIFHSGEIKLKNSELEEAIRSAKSNIEFEQYQTAMDLMDRITKQYAHSSEAWYYLACAETEKFTKENADAEMHLEYARRTAQDSIEKSDFMRTINKAKRRMEKLPELRSENEEVERIRTELDTLKSRYETYGLKIPQEERELQMEENKIASAQSEAARYNKTLFLNRLRRLVQAVFAVGLFVLLPWTRDLWNQNVPEQNQITIFADLSGNIRHAIGNVIPKDFSQTFGLVLSLLCLIVFFCALYSGKASAAKRGKKAAKRREEESKKVIDSKEKMIQAVRQDRAAMIEERERLSKQMENLKQKIEAVLSNV